MEGENGQFDEYNGLPNKMTWNALTSFGSYYETYMTLRSVAEKQGQDAVRIQTLSWIDAWFDAKHTPDGVDVFMQSVLSTGVDYASWWNIADALQGMKPIAVDNPFTQTMYDAVQKMDWESMLAEPSEPDETEPMEKHVDYALSSFEERLSGYYKSLLLTWAESRRRRSPTQARKLAQQITKIYLDQIVWERVTASLKGA